LTRPRKIDDETVARLLSGRDLPSVLEKERLFERIHAHVAAQPTATRSTWQRWVWACAGAAALLAAALFRPIATEFAARGSALPNTPSFRPLCVGEAISRCKPGSALAFEVSSGSATPYFAAFARRADGTVVWYFPAANGVSVPLVATGGSALLDHGVQIGAEQPPGHYEIYGIFSALPLSRAELRTALGDDLKGSAGITVVRRSFEVSP